MNKIKKLGGRLSKGLLTLALALAAVIAAPANTSAAGLPFQVTEDPAGATYYLNDPATPLRASFAYNPSSVNGYINSSAPITVQWYWSTTNSTAGRSNGQGVSTIKYDRIINHTTTHTPSTSTVGVRYYYAVVSYEESISVGSGQAEYVKREAVTNPARIEVIVRNNPDNNNGNNNSSSSTGNNNSSSESTETDDDLIADDDDISDQVTEEDDKCPKFENKIIGDGKRTSWALANLVLMAFGILVTLAVLFRAIITKKKHNITWAVLTGVLAAAGVILFILTEDISKPMVIVDFWTIFQALAACLCIAFAIKAFQNKLAADKQSDVDKESDPEPKDNSSKKDDKK